MKKPLTKLLAHLAKDGDIDTVAEFIGEMIGEESETPAEAVAEAATEAVEAVEEAVEAATEETAQPAVTVTADEDGLAGIIERLDRLIALLTPAAGDEDPGEEIAEVVEEVVEAVQAEAEETVPVDEGAAGALAEQISEMVESILESEPSGTIGEEDEGCDPDKPIASDSLRAALVAVRPALKRMSNAQRTKACREMAHRLPRKSPNGADSRYALMKSSIGDTAELGKRIMAARNPNYHK